jgi:hypothetical protein
MASPLGGDVGPPGAPTTFFEDVNGEAPWGSDLRPWSEGVL